LISKDKAMTDKFLKIRIPVPLYRRLYERASELGQRVSTHARERLEKTESQPNVEQLMTRLEAILNGSAERSAPMSESPRPELLQSQLAELLLLTRELAMSHNAQILARVAAQLKRNGGAA